MRSLTTILAVLCTSVGAHAADLTVDVRDQGGSPVANAVVTFHPNAASYGVERAPVVSEVAQRDLQFTPFVTVLPVGSEVIFTNEDNVLHHVFSFSPAKRFDLRLFGREEPQWVDFDRAGTVAVGCNIHDDMIAYLRIVETPFAARTSESGAAVLADAPPGSGTLRVWHPNLRGKDNQVARDVVVASDGARVDVAIELRVQRSSRRRY